MAFDKSRVYTALNADELKIGSKVYVADNIGCLIDCVIENCNPVTLSEVRGAEHKDRFVALSDDKVAFNLAYLVAEPEEKHLDLSDFKVGDILRKEEYIAMVVMIDTKDEGHICLGNGRWLDDDELAKWKKVEADDELPVWRTAKAED